MWNDAFSGPRCRHADTIRSYIIAPNTQKMDTLLKPEILIPLASSGFLVDALLVIHHRQHALQRKMVSAQILHKLLEHWDTHNYKRFVDMTKIISNPRTDVSEDILHTYLGHWEGMATFYKEGTLTKSHAKFFEPYLQDIRNNKVVWGCLKSVHDNDKAAYNNLWKMIRDLTSPPPAVQA